jgi:serine protease Do
MGFAIPSTTVIKSLSDLKNYGYITGKARLGVTIETKQYQTWPYLQTHSYIQVTEINPNGSAAKSGLQVGDILYQFNGKEIASFDILSKQLTKYAVGDTITLTIRRPTVELTNNNLSEYLNTSKEITLTITFVEFDPNE